MATDNDNPYISMSIASFGAATLPREEKKVFAVKNTNATDDIDGAKPRETKVWQKPDMWDTRDVSGSQSKTLHYQRTRAAPDNSLRVDDIDGAQAKIRDKMLLTKRCTNPLAPGYSLPKHAEAPPHEPKFLRNTLDISDIDRAAPAVPVRYKTRDPISVQDIVGAQANWRPRHERARLEADPYPLMEVGDVTRRTHRYVDRTTRVAQVLDPVYVLHGEVVMDDPRYTKPKPLKKEIKDGHLLSTKDIPGAFAGWTKGGRERREWKNTNYTGDIEGAQADTIKHSITTTRCIHPLSKVYTSLDGEQLLGPVNTLVPAHIIKEPTLRNNTHGGGGGSSSTAAGNLQATAGDCLSGTTPPPSGKRQALAGPETNAADNSNTLNLGGGSNTGRKSPRSMPPLTSIDSAAYSTKEPADPHINTGTGASDGWGSTGASGGRSAGATPRTGRLSARRPDSASRPQEEAQPEPVSYADKFIKTEQLILPPRDSGIAAQVNGNGNMGKPPRPSGGGAHPGSARPPMQVPPPLDFSKFNTNGANVVGSGGSARSNRAGSAGGSARRSNSARAAPQMSPAQRKEALELKDAIDSVRALG